MKLVSQKLSLILAGAALLFAGCSKKPERPDPSATLGQKVGDPNGANMNGNVSGLGPSTLNDLPVNNPFDLNGQNKEMFAANTVYFDYDASAIKASEREKLKGIKEKLAADSSIRILLEGHCDWRGTAEYNLGLGDRRANAVKKYLLSLGVAADRLETVSKGSLEAKAQASAAEMEKDRRVDLIAVKAGAGAPLPAAATAPAVPAGLK